jgi:hypothetical protein
LVEGSDLQRRAPTDPTQEKKKKVCRRIYLSIDPSIEIFRQIADEKIYIPKCDEKILGIDRELQTSAEHRSKSLPQIRYQNTTQNGK